MNPKLTPDQQKLLSAYRATGLISITAPLAGVLPTLHEDSLQTSDAYRKFY